MKLDIRLTQQPPTLDSPLYQEPILVDDDVIVKAITIAGSNKYNDTSKIFKSELEQPNYLNPYSEKYPLVMGIALVDGITGGLNFNDGRWQGFEKGL